MSAIQSYIHHQEEDNITFKIRSSLQQFIEKCVFNSRYKYDSDFFPKASAVRSLSGNLRYIYKCMHMYIYSQGFDELQSLLSAWKLLGLCDWKK